MTDDYPAAHSMDTDWFAVDMDGNVAILLTGEDGPLPLEWEKVRVTNGGYDGFNLIADVENYLGRKAPLNKFDFPQVEALGFFCYEHSLFVDDALNEEHDLDALTPYERIAIPATPLRLENLPTELSTRVSLVRFERVNFNSASRLQPVKDMKCVSWSEYRYWLDENLQPNNVEEDQLVMPGEIALYISSLNATEQRAKPWWKRIFGLE